MKNLRSRDNKEIKERIQKIAVADSLKPSRISLCLIAMLELYFLISWMIFDRSFTDLSELRYFLSYVFLLTFSIVAFVLSFVFERDPENGYKKLRLLEAVAAIFLLLWAVLVTIFDADHHTEFSYIIYATIVVILPAVIYINRWLLNFIYLLCDGILIAFTIIIKPDNFLSTILNFSVFAIVSLCACNLYKNMKSVSIRREIALQEMAERDLLTGLYNRQRLNAISSSIIRETYKASEKLTCVMADVDNFKHINDEYGHLTGDKVLENVARIIREEVKQNAGLAFRYGGEEFLILFSQYTNRQVCDIVERIQKRLKDEIHTVKEPITLSFGVYTTLPKANDNIEQYYEAADQLMYVSKTEGKDRYTVCDQS